MIGAGIVGDFIIGAHEGAGDLVGGGPVAPTVSPSPMQTISNQFSPIAASKLGGRLQ